MTLPPEPKLYTAQEAWKVLRVSRATFYRMVQSHRIRLVKFGRSTAVRRDDLEALIEAATAKD